MENAGGDGVIADLRRCIGIRHGHFALDGTAGWELDEFGPGHVHGGELLAFAGGHFKGKPLGAARTTEHGLSSSAVGDGDGGLNGLQRHEVWTREFHGDIKLRMGRDGAQGEKTEKETHNGGETD